MSKKAKSASREFELGHFFPLFLSLGYVHNWCIGVCVRVCECMLVLVCVCVAMASHLYLLNYCLETYESRSSCCFFRSSSSVATQFH